jgi:hypothetical protein
MSDLVVPEPWPALPYDPWRETKATLHMDTQVVGKLRLALSPFEPEWANVPLYLTGRGLTTSPIPWDGGSFEVRLDLIGDDVTIETSEGRRRSFPLATRPVATFYRELMAALGDLGIQVAITTLPSEVTNPIRFDEDTVHDHWDEPAVHRFWKVLSRIDHVLKRFRARFRGRTTPVQFYWGTFDLALTRFSGKPATPPLGAGSIERVAFDAELYEAGFWPGDERYGDPALYALAHPRPSGLEQAVLPLGDWSEDRGIFLLPYEEVRGAASPEQAILGFLETTYDAVATRLGWDPALVP